MNKLRLLSFISAFFLSMPCFSEQLREPQELSGPNKVVKELSKETKGMYEQLLEAMALLDEKDSKKTKQAIEKLNKIIELNPEYSDGYFVRAMANFNFLRSTNHQQIIDDINRSIEFFPSKKYESPYKSTAPQYSLRAKVYKEMGKYQQTLKDLESSIIIDPTEAIQPTGVDPSEEPKHGSWGKKDFDDLIIKYPNDYRVYLFRGLYYYSFGLLLNNVKQGYESAISDFKKAISLNQKSAIANYLLGCVYDRRLVFARKSEAEYQREAKVRLKGLSIWMAYPDECKNIVAAFSIAVQFNPKFIDAYRGRAEIYLETKEYQLAIKDYDKIIDLDPESGGTYHDRALAYHNIGKYRAAITDFTKAIEAKKKPTSTYSTYVGRADAYMALAEYSSAIDDFTSAIESEIENCVLLMSVSQFRKVYPEYKDVTDDYLAEKLHKKFYPNLKYDDFARMFLKENKDFASSIVPELYVKRGDAYLEFGDYRKALEDYNRVKAFPTYSTYFDEWERWKQFYRNSLGDKYYLDIKTVGYPMTGDVKFWTKIIYNKSEGAKAAYCMQNMEVNCSSKMYRIISYIEYDSDGKVMRQHSGSEWEYIIPDSVGEILFAGWCR